MTPTSRGRSGPTKRRRPTTPYASNWVRVGDDALLVDLRTGEVLDVVYELFW